VTDTKPPGFWRSKTGMVCVGFLAVAAFFLATEHTAHFLRALPWLLLAACPLMHLFMHHGGGHDRDAHSDTRAPDAGGSPSDQRP
jgi:hypothetical protein